MWIRPPETPPAESLEEREFVDGVAVVRVAEIADPVGSRRHRIRRSATHLTAMLIVVGLHGAALLLWRAAIPPPSRQIASDPGTGGISLTLVSGRAGGFFADSTATTGVEATASAGRPTFPTSVGDATPQTPLVGVLGEDTRAETQGHSMGGSGEGTTTASEASVGSGYDPGAYASLAPASFSKSSQPGLWDQVRRCFKGEPASDLLLTVVLDDSGAYINAYPSGGASVTAQDQAAAQALANAQAALKACSPYHAVPGGLANRLTLVVPAPLRNGRPSGL